MGEKRVDKQDTERAFESSDDLIDNVPDVMARMDSACNEQHVRQALVRSMPLGRVKKESTKDRIRKLTALEYAGFTAEEAGASMDPPMSARYVHTFKGKYRDAFEDARKIHLIETARQYHMNLLRVKSAVSAAGPRAIKTLVEIMEDEGQSGANRVRAATNVLKLIGTDEQTKTESMIAKQFITAMKDALAPGEELYIVDGDIEEAEIVDDDAVMLDA